MSVEEFTSPRSMKSAGVVGWLIRVLQDRYVTLLEPDIFQRAVLLSAFALQVVAGQESAPNLRGRTAPQGGRRAI
jgi:hypothetical protein